MVKIVEYVSEEGQRVSEGETIAIIENWWARMALTAVGPGYMSKTFFSPHTYVNEGDPFAIIVCDPEDGPGTEETCQLSVISEIRKKPK